MDNLQLGSNSSFSPKLYPSCNSYYIMLDSFYSSFNDCFINFLTEVVVKTLGIDKRTFPFNITKNLLLISLSL